MIFIALTGCFAYNLMNVGDVAAATSGSGTDIQPEDPRAGGDGALMFKHEYEVLNGQTTPDGEHIYKEVIVPSGIPIVYMDDEDAKVLLTSGSGALFMGFPECPWCRTLLPALVSAYEKSDYTGVIYYYNALEDRDALSLSEDGEIVVEAEGAPVYHDLVAILYDYLMPYSGLGDESIRRIYLPTTVFVKNGDISSVHLTTIESQESGYDVLTDEQFAELEGILIEKFNAISDSA